MSLQERLQEELKAAMRQRDPVRSNVLRMLKAAIRNAEIDAQRTLDDAGVLAVLDKAAKQRRESIEAYRRGGREELVAAEEAELHIIEAYLPRQLGEAEIRAAVEQTIAELGAQGPADMGRVMKVLMDRLRGQADGKVVNAVVREVLAARAR
jgi:uncharacterized protein YqeY